MSGYFKELISGTKSLFIGLGITGKYFFEPVVTLQYPHEHLEMTARYRGHIELIPNDPNPYDSYAELLLKLGKFDQSIENYKKAYPELYSGTPGRTASGGVRIYCEETREKSLEDFVA